MHTGFTELAVAMRRGFVGCWGWGMRYAIASGRALSGCQDLVVEVRNIIIGSYLHIGSCEVELGELREGADSQRE